MKRRGIAAAAVAATMGLIASVSALAHIERPAYWPNPGADCRVTPCAGGKVPKFRSLASALKKSKKSNTRVVCQRGSLKRALASIKTARTKGFKIRPTQHTRKLSAKQARKLAGINRGLAKRLDRKSVV